MKELTLHEWKLLQDLTLNGWSPVLNGLGYRLSHKLRQKEILAILQKIKPEEPVCQNCDLSKGIYWKKTLLDFHPTEGWRCSKCLRVILPGKESQS